MSKVRDRVIAAFAFGAAAFAVAFGLAMFDGWRELAYPGIPAIIAAIISGAWVGGNALIKYRHHAVAGQENGAVIGCGVTIVAYLLFSILTFGWAAVTGATFSFSDVPIALAAFFYYTLIYFPILIGVALIGGITGHFLVRTLDLSRQKGAS